jgi:flagellin FlaB
MLVLSHNQGVNKQNKKEEPMLKKIIKVMNHDQKGITGLETAIILIAFVVVASVFAYTVLSAGIFSSEKGKEAVYAGLDQARSSMTLKGSVVAMGDVAENELTSVVFTVANALDGEAIDLTPPAGGTNVTVISCFDNNQRMEDIDWTTVKLGDSDEDDLLEPGEKFEITVDVTDFEIGPYTTFTLEVKPPKGSVLNIESTTPATIDAVNILR